MAYTEPTSTDFKMRYPAFTDIDNVTITWWLNFVVGLNVDQSWSAGNGPEGHMAAAAHKMVKAGVPIAGSAVGGFAAAGVTQFKSGTFTAEFSNDAVKQAVSNEWSSTTYGSDYEMALAKEKSGPRASAPGAAPCGYGYRDSPLPPC